MKVKDRIRWRIATVVDRLPGQCWAELSDWATASRPFPWRPRTRGCRADLARCGSCYCGKLRGPGGGDPS